MYHNINSFHPGAGKKACYPWSDIAAGRWDAMLAQRADESRQWGYPVIMSFTHEPTVDSLLDNTGNGGQWWLDSSPQALAAFAAAGANPYFS